MSRQSVERSNVNKRKSFSDENYVKTFKIQKNSTNKFKRSGKWSTEEEALALQLIVEFESGTLLPHECPPGTTLRSFLSRRLSCAPMRISKKFAKKQIGKLMYSPLPNLSSNPPDHSTLKHLEEVYLASDPFDNCEADSEPDASLASFPVDQEGQTDESISSDNDDSISNENFNMGQALSHDDLLEDQMNDEIAFFDNEVEEWKSVLNYFLGRHPSEEQLSQLGVTA